MTIAEQMIFIVEDIINKNGLNCKVRTKDFHELLGTAFGTKKGSIIPSDYCYNRTNKDVDFLKKPRLLFFCGDGEYECLGINYIANCPVYTCPKGTTTDVNVGIWENGVFHKNENWYLYGLK